MRPTPLNIRPPTELNPIAVVSDKTQLPNHALIRICKTLNQMYKLQGNKIGGATANLQFNPETRSGHDYDMFIPLASGEGEFVLFGENRSSRAQNPCTDHVFCILYPCALLRDIRTTLLLLSPFAVAALSGTSLPFSHGDFPP